MAGIPQRKEKDLAEEQLMFSEGDWIVHLMYGPGRIQAIETKSIAGVESKYYRVLAEDSEYWVPAADTAGNDRVRPLATPERIQRALQILKEAPGEMESDHNVRRKRIHDTALDGALRSDVELIRDLSAREHQRGINKSEQEALQRVKFRFLKEWAISLDMDVQNAHRELDELLQENWRLAEQAELSN